MKILRRLSFQGEPDQLVAFLRELSSALPEGWFSSRPDKPPWAPSASFLELYSIHVSPNAGIPACEVFLVQNDPRSLQVANIISLEGENIDIPRYNAVLEMIGDRFASSIAHQFQINIDLTPDDLNLKDYLSPDAARKLISFSARAHKGTGGAHPEDQQRWLDFIVTAHRDQMRISAELLERWLVEEEQWDQDDAGRLADEYAFGREILAYSHGQLA